MEISLRRRHTLIIEEGAFSHKIDCVKFFFKQNLNVEGHLNCFICSKFTAILVNGGILPSGGVASEGSAPAACAARLFCTNDLAHWYK